MSNDTLEMNGIDESTATATAKAPKGKKVIVVDKVVKLVIPEIKVQVLDVVLKGRTPLVVRAWDEKTADILAKKAQGVKSKGREDIVPEDVYNAARYVSEEGWDGIPASAFKAALVDAVSTSDVSKADFNMTLGKKTFFIRADGVCRKSGRELVRIVGTPKLFAQMQRTTTGQPYMSYRPIYREWSTTITVEYNAARIDAQGVLNLVAMAGYFVGVGEHRPSAPKSKTGDNGRWDVLESTGGKVTPTLPTPKLPTPKLSKKKKDADADLGDA